MIERSSTTHQKIILVLTHSVPAGAAFNPYIVPLLFTIHEPPGVSGLVGQKANGLVGQKAGDTPNIPRCQLSTVPVLLVVTDPVPSV
jgi:hypothetical protein